MLTRRISLRRDARRPSRLLFAQAADPLAVHHALLMAGDAVLAGATGGYKLFNMKL